MLWLLCFQKHDGGAECHTPLSQKNLEHGQALSSKSTRATIIVVGGKFLIKQHLKHLSWRLVKPIVRTSAWPPFWSRNASRTWLRVRESWFMNMCWSKAETDLPSQASDTYKDTSLHKILTDRSKGWQTPMLRFPNCEANVCSQARHSLNAASRVQFGGMVECILQMVPVSALLHGYQTRGINNH